jgi:hypothetical protein
VALPKPGALRQEQLAIWVAPFKQALRGEWTMMSIARLPAVSGAADHGEEVGEGPVGASDIAGCIEVLQEAADDCQDDGS